MKDIDTQLLDNFAFHLKTTLGVRTGAHKFGCICSFLRCAAHLGLSEPLEDIVPRKRFNLRDAGAASAKPYTDKERSAIAQALLRDLRAIKSGSDLNISELQAIVVMLHLLALRTGLNASSLLNLSRDALRPHPVRPDWRSLVTFKPRASKEISVPLPITSGEDAFRLADNSAVILYREIIAYTDDLSKRASESDKIYAFLRPPVQPRSYARRNGSCTGLPVRLTYNDIRNATTDIGDRHSLLGDDGKPLSISTSRMRATLAQKIDRLSNHDPVVKAGLLGNSTSVANTNYVEPDFDAPAEFAAAQARLLERLAAKPPIQSVKTPAGNCTDTLNGRFAPKDGVTHCERWLNCFKCPNQCITGKPDDLWRMYSFYWLLQSKSQELRSLPVSGMTRFVIHIMDTLMIDRFGKKARDARDRARKQPHPLWSYVNKNGLLLDQTRDA